MDGWEALDKKYNFLKQELSSVDWAIERKEKEIEELKTRQAGICEDILSIEEILHL